VPGLPQRPQHPGDVPGPAGDGSGHEVVRAALPDRVVLLRRHAPAAVVATGHGHEAPVLDGEGQDRPAVVVQVLADEVHAAGGGPDPVRVGVGEADERLGRVGEVLVQLGGGDQVGVVHGVSCGSGSVVGSDTGTAPGSVAAAGPAEVPAGAGVTTDPGKDDGSSRSRSTIRSGVVSDTQAPCPDSDPARYLSLPAARSTENTCRCSRGSASRSPSRSGPTGAANQPAMYGSVMASPSSPRKNWSSRVSRSG
jgi:hypothetical protein